MRKELDNGDKSKHIPGRYWQTAPASRPPMPDRILRPPFTRRDAGCSLSHPLYILYRSSIPHPRNKQHTIKKNRK
jgi:hypothetical protein